jgi:hypothetical protein
VFGGGDTNGGPTSSNVIDYVTIAATGNATDFGDLTVARYGAAGCASETRGLFAGGGIGPTNVIDYITIATTGNAIDFGDLLEDLRRLAGCASSTRGVFAGGYVTNAIQYVTIASTGNATDFGDLPYDYKYSLAGCSSAASAVQPTPTSAAMAFFGGGSDTEAQASIQYVNIATTGNSMLFGDLTVAKYNTGSCASLTRGVWAGGNAGSVTNVIEYIEFSTAGKATDFGDLLTTVGKTTNDPVILLS